MKIKYRKTWKNTIRKFKTQPLKFIEPENLDDIRHIVREAEADGLEVRAVGSGHSFSDVAVTLDYLLDLKRLNSVKDVKKGWLKDPSEASQLVEAEAGITIQKFNKVVDRTRDLCVLNMGGVDNQTLAGAISTGTHGSGIDLPAIPGMVRSIVLVADGGKVYRIEPENGITDPDKYEEGFQLIQDDDTFNSVLVSMGCMGVIYSFILKLEKMYWLEECKTRVKWSKLREKLEDGSLLNGKACNGQKCRSVMIQVNPFPDKNGDHTAVLVQHRLLNTKPHRTIKDRTRNVVSSIMGNILLPAWFSKALIRIFPKTTAWVIGTSLKSVVDLRYENKGYKVLHQGLEILKRGAYDCELAFDLKDDSYLQAMDAMFAMVKKLAEEFRLYPSAPLGLRFVKASTAYLCPDYDKDVCYIDTPVLNGTIGGDIIVDQYQETCFKLNGIPHWGKLHNKLWEHPDLISKYYPKLPVWAQTFRKFNSKGTFNNRISDRLEDLGLIPKEVIKESLPVD